MTCCLSSLLLGTKMEYAFDIPSTCLGVVTNRCNLKVANHVFKNLDDEHKDLFVESCFRSLVHIPDLKFSSQIIHHLLQRTLKSSENEKDVVWFKFGEKEARFGLQEFFLVSELKIVDNVASYEVPKRSSSLLNLFKGKRGKITKKDLLNQFDDLVKKEGDEDLKYKLGLLMVFEHVVLSNECRTLVDEKWFHLVENLEEFDTYPWGNLSYEYTVSAFEALPELGRKFAETCGSGRLPRMMSWKMNKQWRSEHLTTFFNTSEVEVRRTLQPSSDEVQSSYLKEFDIPSTRATYDGTNVDEEVDPESNQRDRTVDGVEDTINSPSPMPEKQMVGVHDDVGLQMRAKDNVVLVEDNISEKVVSPKKNEHEFDTGVVTDPSSTIVVFQERQLCGPTEVEKTDEDDAPGSPKGRGYRKKRKAAVLLTPWRNPEKRQKIPSVTEYDLYRTLDEAKCEDLKSTERIFNDLLNDEWLSSEYPLLFRQDCIIVDPHFVSYVRMFFKEGSKAQSFDTINFQKALVNYARGKVPTHGKPWTSCTKLYVPFCNEKNDH
ncbi:hypothetical protein STAS_28975, partial [Striga asiatica]